MSAHERALNYPTSEWFDVTTLTGGTADGECWLRLCNAALAHFVRPGDGAQLITNESRSRFCWLPRGERHFAYAWLRKREEQ